MQPGEVIREATLRCFICASDSLHLSSDSEFVIVICSFSNNTGPAVYDSGFDKSTNVYTDMPEAQLKLGKGNAVKVKPLSAYPKKKARAIAGSRDANLLALQRVRTMYC